MDEDLLIYLEARYNAEKYIRSHDLTDDQIAEIDSYPTERPVSPELHRSVTWLIADHFAELSEFMEG